MKTLLIVAVILSGLSLAGFEEVEISGIYAADPYTRCIESHEGTPAAAECEALKL